MARQFLRKVSQFVDSGLTVYVSKLILTFPTPHIGHSRDGLFFTRWIVNHMLNLLKRSMTYPRFDPRTLVVTIPIHYTISIWVVCLFHGLFVTGSCDHVLGQKINLLIFPISSPFKKKYIFLVIEFTSGHATHFFSIS
jgi:hypothetical protein